jgi:hypothetical protein
LETARINHKAAQDLLIHLEGKGTFFPEELDALLKKEKAIKEVPLV